MIPVYKNEKEAGISKAITKNNSVAYISPVFEASKDDKMIVPMNLSSFASEENSISDLHPIYTILVTTGWNKNDDIFTKDETWKARLTPEDKPFNLEHRPRKIIGHITENYTVDENMKKIDDDSSIEDIPDKFHVVTGAVVYKHLTCADESLEKESAELIEGIKNGEWFVSMECLFTDFDYGFITENGIKVVKRTEANSYLTKHLKIYGGTGEYDGARFGRVLKNIIFSGKGLVEKPANPESIILDVESVSASCEDKLESLNKENNMADNHLESEIKSLKEQLGEARANLKELGEEQVKASLKERDDKIESLSKELASVNEKLDEISEEKESITKERDELVEAKNKCEKESKEATKKLIEAETSLKEIAEKEKATARISSLVDKGVDKAEAEKVVAEFADLDNEKFDKIADMKAEAVKGGKKEGEEKEEDDEEKPADEDPEGEANANKTNLEEAKPENDATLASAGENGENDFMVSLADFIDGQMHGDKNDK